VHPDFLKCGVGKALIDFSIKCSIKTDVRSIRLDVYEGNIPAIKLYEKCGFKYIDTVDLGLGNYGLNWFKLYEKII
ncbi:GNAT family N-acetyltransferase, partial [Clostridium sp.]|uniref:GNAT family N-acetyltransferase n=1 Tax=Clostridium sp. TaxID=1506 RepID=UPI00261148F2